MFSRQRAPSACPRSSERNNTAFYFVTLIFTCSDASVLRYGVVGVVKWKLV